MWSAPNFLDQERGEARDEINLTQLAEHSIGQNIHAAVGASKKRLAGSQEHEVLEELFRTFANSIVSSYWR